MGTPSCSESADSMSLAAMKPRSTRILPSLSPRSFCSSSARSTSSGSRSRRATRISPRRMGRLKFLNFHDRVERYTLEFGVDKLATLPLHEDLPRQAGRVFLRAVEQGH